MFHKRSVLYSEGLLAPRPTHNWRTTPCRLSAAAYSIYSQLTSIAGGHLFHPQPKDAPCCSEKETHLTGDLQEIYNIWIDRRQHSNVLEVQSYS
jgi:hypothetical protein